MDCAIDVDSASAKILAEWDWKTQSSLFGGDDQDSLEPSAFGDHEQDSLHSNSPSQSSFDSMCSSPETTSSSNSCGLHQNAMDFSFGFPGGHHSAAALRAARALARRHHHQSQQAKQQKMSIKTRVKASEREKMRMRSLAEALHELRDYLPPHYSKKGQPLTKIQTLKYTIDYINTLSDILDRA